MLPDRLLTLTRHFIAPPSISTSSSTTPFTSSLDSPASPFPDVELDDLSHLYNTPPDVEDTESCASSQISDSEPSSRRSSISSFASSLFFRASTTPIAKPTKRQSLPSPIQVPEAPKSKQIFASGMTNTRYRQAHQQACRSYW